MDNVSCVKFYIIGLFYQVETQNLSQQLLNWCGIIELDSMKKKLLLVFLMGFEFVIGFGFLWIYFQHKKTQSQVLGTTMVAKIDETKVIKNLDKELSHYWEYKPNEVVSDNPLWLKSPITYAINSDGLNDQKNYEIEKNAQNYRIITLGDSFTFGHFVNTAENWTEVLEKMFSTQSIEKCGLGKIEVLNLGMPGFDSEEIVRRYQRIGQKYNPDLVVWFESGSGFYRNNEVMQPLIEDCFNKNSSESADSESIYKIYGNCWTQASSYMSENYTENQLLQQLEVNINDLLSLVSQDKMAFIYNDEGQYYKESYINNWQNKYPQASFYFPTLKLDEEIAHLADGHPNQLGHKRIARAVFDFILANKLQCLNN